MRSLIAKRAAVVAAAAVTGLLIWGAVRLAGIELELKDDATIDEVMAGDVLVASVLAGVAAWVVHSALVHYGRQRWWPFIGSTALAVSMLGPSYMADGEAAMALMLMHVVVGAVLIAGFAATAGHGDCEGSSPFDAARALPASPW